MIQTPSSNEGHIYTNLSWREVSAQHTFLMPWLWVDPSKRYTKLNRTWILVLRSLQSIFYNGETWQNTVSSRSINFPGEIKMTCIHLCIWKRHSEKHYEVRGAGRRVELILGWWNDLTLHSFMRPRSAECSELLLCTWHLGWGCVSIFIL